MNRNNPLISVFFRFKHAVRVFVEYPFKVFFSYRFLHERKRIQKPYFFLNNSIGSDTVCIILAGYKEFAWECVFERIKTFCPDNIDICVVSSGIYVDRLKEIAIANKWSYVAMKRNNICLALNSSIALFPQAKKIFKLDEDIFVTKGFFELLPKTHELAKKDYKPCFTAPLINVNAYGYRRILDKLDLKEEYTHKFEYPQYWFSKIGSDINVAKYLWGEGGDIPLLDELNSRFSNEPMMYSVCPIRFSIGALYFEREILDNYGIFPVHAGNDLGTDEVYLCIKAGSDLLAMIVSENIVVGHLSYSAQNQGMKEYFKSHPEVFYLKH